MTERGYSVSLERSRELLERRMAGYRSVMARAWARQNMASRTVGDYRPGITSYLAWCKKEVAYIISVES